jgi:hypothetical protein
MSNNNNNNNNNTCCVCVHLSCVLCVYVEQVRDRSKSCETTLKEQLKTGKQANNYVLVLDDLRP